MTYSVGKQQDSFDHYPHKLHMHIWSESSELAKRQRVLQECNFYTHKLPVVLCPQMLCHFSFGTILHKQACPHCICH